MPGRATAARAPGPPPSPQVNRAVQDPHQTFEHPYLLTSAAFADVHSHFTSEL